MKRKNNRPALFRAAALIILTLFVVFLPSLRDISAVRVEAAGSLTELEDRLSKLQRQRKEAQTAVETAKAERADLVTSKTAIDAKILALSEEIDALEQLIDGYETSIAEKNTEISEQTEKLAEQKEILKRRVRAMREDGGFDIVVILFESNGLVDFLTRVDRFVSMLDYNERLVDDFTSGIAALSAKKDELSDAKSVLEERKKTLDQNMIELENDLAAAKKLIADAENDIKNAEKTLQNVDALEKQYNAEREKMLAERQKATNSQYTGGAFSWPLPDKYTTVSCGFGWRTHPITKKPQFHIGIDIPAPYSTPITSVADGTVIEVSSNYADGYYVTIDHGGGLASFYSHVSKYAVKVGDKVKRGQVIAYVGMSGYATGYHLNLNIYKDSKAVNPMDYFK